jgi:hypothetical protein
MDSSELTKFRRNRTEANSNNGQKATKPPNKITQMSAQSALNIFLGGKVVEYDKRTILPNCGGKNGAGCTQDVLEDGILLPPDCPQVLSISYLNSVETDSGGIPLLTFQPSGGFTGSVGPQLTFNPIFGPGTPTNGTFYISAAEIPNPFPPPPTPPLPTPPYPGYNPISFGPNGLLIVPGDVIASPTNPSGQRDPSQAIWTITYTTICGQAQWSQALAPP